MKKKVLLLSASPRIGGNSDILCNQFIKGAQESGHDTEKVYLQKQKLGYCLACNSCLQTKKCVQKDSGNEILEKIVTLMKYKSILKINPNQRKSTFTLLSPYVF